MSGLDADLVDELDQVVITGLIGAFSLSKDVLLGPRRRDPRLDRVTVTDGSPVRDQVDVLVLAPTREGGQSAHLPDGAALVPALHRVASRIGRVESLSEQIDSVLIVSRAERLLDFVEPVARTGDLPLPPVGGQKQRTLALSLGRALPSHRGRRRGAGVDETRRRATQ